MFFPQKNSYTNNIFHKSFKYEYSSYFISYSCLTWDTFLYLGILIIQNAFSTLKVMNSNLLNVFPFTEFQKFWVFFLKPDLIPTLHLLKLNVLLSNIVTIIVTICIVGKRSHFFSIWVFFHEHSQFTGQQGKGEAISLTPL